MRRRWNETLVLEEIRRWHETGKSITSGYIQRHAKALFNAAQRRFGNIRNAVAAAGIPYPVIKQGRYGRLWTKVKIIDEIRALALAGEPLNEQAANRRYPGLYGAVYRICGSWGGDGVIAAGLDYEAIRLRKLRWSRGDILSGIKSRLERGLPLNVWAVRFQDPRLLGAAEKAYGNWQKAVEAAGESYRRHCRAYPMRTWLKTLSPESLALLEEQTMRFVAIRRQHRRR